MERSERPAFFDETQRKLALSEAEGDLLFDRAQPGDWPFRSSVRLRTLQLKRHGFNALAG